MRFGQLLAALRQARGLSQLDLSVIAGVAQRHISFLETGRALPGPRSAAKLARALQLTPCDKALFALAVLETADTSPPTTGPAEYWSGDAPSRAQPNRRCLQPDDGKHLVRLVETQSPLPAIATNASGDVIVTNRAFDRALSLASPDIPLWQVTCDGVRNFYALTLHERGLLHFAAEPSAIVDVALARLSRAAPFDQRAWQTLETVRRRFPTAGPHIADDHPDRTATEEAYVVDGQRLSFHPIELELQRRSHDGQQLFVSVYAPRDAQTAAFLNGGSGNPT